MKHPLTIKEQIQQRLPEGITLCTNEQLSALGEAIVEQVLIGFRQLIGDKEEWITIGKLAKRYHINPITLRDRLERNKCRTIDPPPGSTGWRKYNVTDAQKIMTNP